MTGAQVKEYEMVSTHEEEIENNDQVITHVDGDNKA